MKIKEKEVSKKTQQAKPLWTRSPIVQSFGIVLKRCKMQTLYWINWHLYEAPFA